MNPSFVARGVRLRGAFSGFRAGAAASGSRPPSATTLAEGHAAGNFATFGTRLRKARFLTIS